jgi:dTDP-4-dehydrorhamnose 3,5-epimerase
MPACTYLEDLKAYYAWCKQHSPRAITPTSFPVLAYILPGQLKAAIFFTKKDLEKLLADTPFEEKTNDGNCFVDAAILGVQAISKVYADKRGWLTEAARSDESGDTPMTYVSHTKPGVVRGPHEHAFQTDRFVFVGAWTLWLWDNRSTYPTFRNRQKLTSNPLLPRLYPDMKIAEALNMPCRVVIPSGVVHAYRNDSLSQPLLVVNVPDKLYRGFNRKEKPDEIRHEEDANTIFKPW